MQCLGGVSYNNVKKSGLNSYEMKALGHKSIFLDDDVEKEIDWRNKQL